MTTMGEKQEKVRRALLASGYTAEQVSDGLTEAAFRGHYNRDAAELETEVRKILGAAPAAADPSPAVRAYVDQRRQQSEGMKRWGLV